MAEMPLAAARALSSRVAAWEDETSPKDIRITFRDDPEWLQLPLAKRAAAMERHTVLTAYDRKKNPTKADAVAAAAKLKIQLRPFYALLRDWRDKGRTPFSLVPYRVEPGTTRTSRLDPEVAKALIEQVKGMLAEDASISPGKAVRAIGAAWPTALAKPSDVTIRNYLEREKVGQAVTPGTLRLNFGTSPQEEAETATRFGEVIVIDHSSPARLLLDGERAAAPTITLAIDLWSGAPVGVALSDEEPGPAGVVQALADAQERLDDLGRGVPVRPRLVYASTNAREWDELRDELMGAGLEIVERRDHRLHFGGPIKRLIGPSLGGVQLQASKARRKDVGSVDPDKDALLTRAQLELVIGEAVEKVIDERMPESAGRRLGRLALPDWLRDSAGRARRSIRAPRQHQLTALAPEDDGNSPDQQSVDHAWWQEVVEDVVGRHLDRIEVYPPTAASPGWAVEVHVRDSSLLAEVWLRLARTAVEMADFEGEMVRFDVRTGEAR